MRLATGERKVTLIHCVKTGYACGDLLIQQGLGITLSSSKIPQGGLAERSMRMATCSLWTWMKAPIGSINCRSLRM